MSVTESVSVRAPRLPWPGLVVLAAGVFLSITIEMLPTGLLPGMSEGLGVAEPFVGLLVSAFAFAVVVTSTPLTALTSRMPRHGLLVAVLAVLGLTTLASALVPEYWMLVAIRVVGGIAHGLFWALVAAYAARLVPDQQIGRAVSVTLGGGTLALVAGVPATTMLGHVIGWRPVFAIVGALTLVGGLLVWRFLPPVLGEHGETASRFRRGDVALGPVLLVSAVTAVTMLGQYAVFTYVAPLITEVVGLDVGAVGPLLFVYGVAGAAGLALAGSRLAARPMRALVIAMGLVSASLVVLGLAPGAWPSIVAFAVWGVAFGAIPPLLQTRLLRVAPAGHRDAASALYTTAFNIGIGGGALLGAVLFDRLGVAALPFAYAAVLALLMIGLAREAFGATRQPGSTTAPAVGPVRPPAV
ncbi:MFS transporter [Agromyces bauzanensis]|uniref:MFS transporter n=1 Tax=Agromyces bauzanensis TaxID=1308924 RepID=A0A917UQD5_9MICO|nr:MFS transporter [Agromyces bauzanensis]GGJ75680.1 MFS transporter [Agromyces bauzanensis]